MRGLNALIVQSVILPDLCVGCSLRGLENQSSPRVIIKSLYIIWCVPSSGQPSLKLFVSTHHKSFMSGLKWLLSFSLSPPQARLTCPCCNSRVKDAVLTKCFHVFCFECVKTRYDTRQRKCPKCNAAFGANDFHRIYIG